MKNTHKHYLARLLVWAFLIVGIGFWMTRFVVDASYWQLSGWYVWNNNSFLSPAFWQHAPLSWDIVLELYGTGDEGTAYTKGWDGYTSGSCLSGWMDVVYLTGGVHPVSDPLSDHTIYVFNSWTYILETGVLITGNCIAMVGSGDVYVYSTWYVDSLASVLWGKYIISDNIHLNGTYDWSSLDHTTNEYWILISGTDSISINNIQSYNSAKGMFYENVSHASLNNVYAFNNSTLGVKFYLSENITMNNSSVFNNAGNGLTIQTSTWILLNNISSVNNSAHGVAIVWSYNNILQWLDVLNNWVNGVFLTSSTGNIFYGTLHLFDNAAGNLAGTTWNDQYLTWGTWTYFTSLGRATGTINTTTWFLWNYIINPVDSNNNSLISRTSHVIATGAQTRTGKWPLWYSIWESVQIQTQPVIYSGAYLTTWGSYSYALSIWIGVDFTENYITTIPTTFASTSGVTVNILRMNTATYRIFWDMTSEKIGLLTNGVELITGKFLSWADGTKFIFSQFLGIDGTTGIVTHYGTAVILDTTVPLFTWRVASWDVILSGWYYNTTWITITFADTNLSWAILSWLNGNTYLNTWFLSGTTVITWWTYKFTVYDLAGNSTGVIFTIDTTNPILTWTYPITGNNTITTSNNVTFTWTGTELNLSGYQLIVTSGWVPYATGNTGNTSYTVNIPNGSGYARSVTATDRASNTGTFLSIPFTVDVPLSGTFVLSWPMLVTASSKQWTNSQFPVYLQPNKPCDYSITWDNIITRTWTDLSTLGQTIYVSASWADGIRTIYVHMYTGSEHSYTTLTWYLDTTPPPTPSLASPSSGWTTVWGTTFSWYTAIDTWVGTSGYQWLISDTDVFTNVLLSGYTVSLSATPNMALLWVLTGNYFWKVRSIDKLWRTGESLVRPFYYSGADYTPTSFTFDAITNARLDKLYLSSEEEINGLSNGVFALVEITRWNLYINGNDIGWQTWLVDNWDTVQIELVSSDEYDTRVQSTMTIGWFSTYFRITTKEDVTNTDDEDVWDIDTNLSTTEKLQIVSVFMALKDIYSDSTQRETFFTALMSSLQDKIDALDENDDADKIDALQYLYDIIDNYLWGVGNIDDTFVGNSNRYVAPNGKVYQVTYNTTTKTYTSPNFIFKKTFTTLAAMKAYIDTNNGGGAWTSGWTFSASAGRSHTVDTTRQSAPYQAPNGKSYRLFKTTDGRYSSYDFSSAKYFISVDALKSHIYQWNH